AKMITAVDCTILRFHKDKLIPEFFNYYSQSAQYLIDVEAYCTGATRKRISRKNLGKVHVPLPPLPEQKRIVAILDEAFAGIATAVANTEKNLANARELFESYLNSVFSQRGDGWSVKTVGEIADHCLGKMLDKRKNKGVPRPYLRNLNVQWFNIDITDILEMRIEDGELERYQVKQGDLLICEGGYPGRAAIWRGREPMFFQKALHRVRCHEPVYNRWLLYYLYLADATGALKPYFTGAGIQHFTGKALKELRLPVAPLDEAEAIIAGMGEMLEQTQYLELIHRRKLAALTELKQSLLQKAFSGELTAVPQDEIEDALA
ncbi:MAG: restriction endonuclease subunit S, partial [Wenzhouxiangella sp.]